MLFDGTLKGDVLCADAFLGVDLHFDSGIFGRALQARMGVLRRDIVSNSAIIESLDVSKLSKLSVSLLEK